MATEIDLNGWTAPQSFIVAITTGEGAAGEVASVRQDITDRLIASGVRPEDAPQLAGGVLNTFVRLIGQGRDTSEAAVEARRVMVDDSHLTDSPQGQFSTLEQALASGKNVAEAIRAVLGDNAAGVDAATLVKALASGKPLGSDLIAALTATAIGEKVADVPLNAADKLAMALAVGGGAAATAIADVTNGMSPDQAAAFLTGLQASLASGASPGAAMAEAAAVAQAAAAQTAASAGPAAALAAALAAGGAAAAQAVAAMTAGMSGDAAASFGAQLAAALAEGKDAQAAAAQAAQTAAETIRALAAGSVPLSDAARLVAALSQGGGLGGGAALASMVTALASGMSTQDALAESGRQVAAANAQQSAASTPGDPLLAALATGNVAQSILADSGFSNALSNALAAGQSVASAQNEARQVVVAAVEQTRSTSSETILAETARPDTSNTRERTDPKPEPTDTKKTDVAEANKVDVVDIKKVEVAEVKKNEVVETKKEPIVETKKTEIVETKKEEIIENKITTLVNHAPTAVADTGTAVEAGGVNNGTAGSGATGNVLTNDSDIDSGDGKAVSGVGVGDIIVGNYGVLALAANGDYTYVVSQANAAVQALRAASDTLTDVFTYTMRDTAGLTSTATLTITIQGADDAPVAVADAGTAVEAGGTSNGTAGSSATGNVLTNDTDVDSGDGKTVTAHGAATYGTLVINADGSYAYAVDQTNASVQALRTSANTLTDAISYTVQDTAGLTSTATLTITIQGADDAPVAVTDSGTAVEAGGTSNGTAGSSATGNVLTNDTDVDTGDTKTVTAHGAATYGTLVINADGSYTYAVDQTNASVQALRTSANTLTDAISYTVQDTAGLTSTATLTITIQGADDAPVAVADAGTAVEAGGTSNGTAGSSATGNVLTNDTDVDTGDTKTVTSHGAATYGTLVINADGSYTYAVDQTNASVQALRTSANTLTDAISYTVQDTAGLTSTATLTITIQGADDAPVAVTDSGTAVEAGGTNNGTSGAKATGNVLTNDTDVDTGDTKTVTSHGAATYGTLVINADGSYTYTLNEADATAQGLRTSANTLTEVISYTVQDTAGLTSTATLTITIQGADDAPVGVADTGAAAEAGGTSNGTTGSGAAGNVLTNDTDVDSGDTKAVSAHTAANYGTVTINADGGYTYVVNDANTDVQALRTSSNTLVDVISYTVQDTAGLTATSTLSITITGANDAPVGVADAGTAVEAGGTSNGTAGSNATGNVLTNDTDVDSGDTKTVSALAGGTVGVALAGTYGTLTLSSNGAYSYAVDDNNATVQALRTSANTLTDSFTYTVQDTAGLTSTAILTVTIQGANDAPVGVADAATAVEAGGTSNGTAGTNPTGNVLTNDTDVDSGDTKTVSAIAGGTVGVGLAGTYGTLTLSSNGAYTYAVDNSNATVQALRTSSNTLTDAFTYTVQDTGGLTSTAVLTVTIQGANDAPVGVADTATAAEAGGTSNGTAGTNPTGNVLTNDTDVDSGDAKSVSAITGGTVGGATAGSYGSLTLNSDGSYTYTVNNANATVQALASSADTITDTFTYTVQDTAGLTSTATLTVTIQGANDAPTLTAPTAISFSVVASGDYTDQTASLSASDVDSASLTYGLTGGTDNGATFSKTGTYGTLTLNKTTGSYTYAPDDAAINAVSSTTSETFTLTVSDGSLSASQTLTINVTNGSPYTPAAVTTPTNGTPMDQVSVLPSEYPIPYEITLLAGVTYQFQLNSYANSGQAGLSDPMLALGTSFNGSLNRSALFTAGGSLAAPFVAFDDDSGAGLNSQFNYQSATTATYYIYVSGYPGASGQGFDLIVTCLSDPPLPAIAEDAVNPQGDSVGNLFASLGVSQIVVSESLAKADEGLWQYSDDGGAVWQSFAAGVFQPIALGASDLVRFLPNQDWNGTPGSLVVSFDDPAQPGVSVTEVISTSVTAVNDAPVAAGAAHLPIAADVGVTVESLLLENFSDAADAARESQPNSLAGALVVGNAADPAEGQWQFSADNGQTWTSVTTAASDGAAQFVSATDLLRFAPEAGFDGEAAALTVRLVEAGDVIPASGALLNISDADATGGTSRISAETVSIYAEADASPAASDYRAMVLGEPSPTAPPVASEIYAAAYASYDGADVGHAPAPPPDLLDPLHDLWSAAAHAHS